MAKKKSAEIITEPTESLTLESVLSDMPAGDAPVTSQEPQEGPESTESVQPSTVTDQPAPTGKRRGLSQGAVVFRGETWEAKCAAARERLAELKETLANTESAYAVLLSSEDRYRQLEARKATAGQRVVSTVEKIMSVSQADEALVAAYMRRMTLAGSPVTREEAMVTLGLS